MTDKRKKNNKNNKMMIENNQILNKPQDIVNAIVKTFKQISSHANYNLIFLHIKEIFNKIPMIINENNEHLLNNS